MNVPPAEVVQTADRPAYPHLGLGYLSAVLKRNNVDSLIIDAPFDSLTLKEITVKIVRFQPNILGFTGMTHQIGNVAKVALELRTQFPEAVFVLGGAHATVAPARTLQRFPIFDMVVIGEGEETLVDIQRCLTSNNNSMRNLDRIPGIAIRVGTEIKVTNPRAAIENLDSLPFPNYDHVSRTIDTYPIFSSRGCPFKCVFCCRIAGDKLRVRSPQNVVDEIEYAIERYSSRFINFADEQVTIPRKRIVEICNLMVERGFNARIKASVLSRVAPLDQDLLNKLKEAGVVKIDFGVESGNPKILRLIKKGITVESAKKAVWMAKRAGLKTGSYFILGHPYETPETIQDTMELATKLNTDTVSFGIMVPYPGTEVYEMAIKGEGNYKMISDDWSDYDKQLGNALELESLSRRDLEMAQLKAYFTFYFRNHRVLDILRMTYSHRKMLLKMIRKLLHIPES